MKKFKPIGFVIFDKKEDCYLTPVPSVLSSVDSVLTHWHPNPSQAKIFKTRDFAISFIKKILDESYTIDAPLVLCRIFEDKKRYLVESDQHYFVCDKDSEYMIGKLESRSLS